MSPKHWPWPPWKKPPVPPPAPVPPPPPPAPTPPPVVTAAVCLWNNGTPAATLGCTPTMVLDYADGTGSITYGYDSQRTAQQKGKTLMLSVGALTAAQATAIAKTLAANGQSAAVIRPMWEMNATWMSWGEQNISAAQYVSTWNTLHAAFKAVNAGFTFCWCPNAGDGNNLPGRTTYDTFPGASVCDYIGVDIYDALGSVANSQSQMNQIVSFAKSVGLPWCIPEWGLYDNLDDPEFVQMIEMMTGDGTCFMQSLFSQPGLTSGAGTPITNAPNALAAYRAWLG